MSKSDGRSQPGPKKNRDGNSSNGLMLIGLPATPSKEQMNTVVGQLEEELQRTKDHLRASIEQYETSTEELKASNEELTTINIELREKVEELNRAHSDLQNLMASTEIGTLFLDRALFIRRFTPRVQELFNIIPSDIGRPLRHITHKLDYERLVEDAEQVLNNLRIIEREVRTSEGHWFIARLLPYRTLEDKISGVILTFVDITARKQVEQSLRESEERLRLLVDSAEDYGIMIMDSDGRFVIWNTGAEIMFGYSEREALGQRAELIFTPEDIERGAAQEEFATAAREGRAVDERWHIRKDGTRLYLSGVMVPLFIGEAKGYAKIARDLTTQQQAQEKLQAGWAELEQRILERTTKLAEANKSLREEIRERQRIERERLLLLRRIVSSQEDERKRISRELHDQLGQRLTAIRLKLVGVREFYKEHAELGEQIAQLQTLAEQLDADLDFLAWELRPSILDDLGLEAALANYVNEWSKRFDVPVNFHSSGFTDTDFSPTVEANLYRIAQEALNNISKHAEATSVDVILERRGESAVLIIEDNGRGFDLELLTVSLSGKGMGLVGMRERAAIIGGTVEIESTPGQGTTVYARTPMKFEPDALVEEGEV